MAVNKIVTKVDGVINKTINFNDLKAGLAVGSHTITVEAWNGSTLVSAQTRNITIASSDSTAPTITTATVEDANPDKLVVVFSEVVTITNTTGLTITGAATPTLSSPTGSGSNTITFTLSTALTNGQSVTLNIASSNTIKDAANNALAATTKAITNNVAAVVTGAPTTGLVADYNFNETAGDLIDSVNGYNGTLFGSIARDGSKYTFNGANTYIEIPDNDDFSFNNAGVDVPFTIRLKMTFDSLENGWIISRRDQTTVGSQEWQIYYYGGDLSFQMYDKSVLTSSLKKEIDGTNLTVGTSYQIVVKYDGSTNATGLKFILNKDETLAVDTGDSSISGTANSDSKVIIGKVGFSTNTDFYSTSKIDSIRIHKGYEWTTQEISDDFDAIMI